MKYEGYLSNVWFTVVFITPLLLFIYAVTYRFYGLGFDLVSLAVLLVFEALSLLICLPASLLHTLIYKKLKMLKTGVWTRKLLLFLSAALLLALFFFAGVQVSDRAGYLLFPFGLKPVWVVYFIVLAISCFAYRVESE